MYEEKWAYYFLFLSGEPGEKKVDKRLAPVAVNGVWKDNPLKTNEIFPDEKSLLKLKNKHNRKVNFSTDERCLKKKLTPIKIRANSINIKPPDHETRA